MQQQSAASNNRQQQSTASNSSQQQATTGNSSLQLTTTVNSKQQLVTASKQATTINSTQQQLRLQIDFIFVLNVRVCVEPWFDNLVLEYSMLLLFKCSSQSDQFNVRASTTFTNFYYSQVQPFSLIFCLQSS